MLLSKYFDKKGIKRYSYGIQKLATLQPGITHNHTLRMSLTLNHAVWYAVAAVPLLYIAYLAQPAILLVLFATLLAVGFTGLVNVVARHTKLPYGASFGVILLTLVLIIGGFGWYMAAPLQTQVSEFTDKLQSLDADSVSLQLPIVASLNTDVVGLLKDNASQLITQARSLISTSLTFATYFIVTLFIILYGAWNRKLYSHAAKRLTAVWGDSAARDLDAVIMVTRKWLLGRLLSMAVVGVLTYVGLLILQVPTPLFLAAVAGFLSFIPNVGPVLSVVPALLVVAGAGTTQILLVVSLYVFIQFVESYFITPSIQKSLIEIPPALLLGVQFILGTVFGILGLLLAAPLTAITITLVKAHLPDTEST